jgi:HSP20 family protein
MFERRFFEPSLFENFADLDRTFALFDEMRRRLDSNWGVASREATSEPRFAMDDKGDAFVLMAELPGVPKENLEITLTGPVLTLRARRETQLPEGFTAHRRERPSFDITRSVTLPSRVDAEQVTAEAKDGIVTITLPKAADARPRAIPVK